MSWIKYEKDDLSFKVPEKLGFDVFKLIEPEETDNKIKESLPENHKDWWCKVEDGYILNLNGKKKIKYLTTIIVD